MLPVDIILPALACSLTHNRSVVLQAPPGTGKTTRVAPHLLDAPWLQGRKIIMLEPRRLAARAAATFMARQRHEAVGQTIGYQIRLERQISSATRIEILTEGLLVQRLLNDPELSDTGLVIFDEFHERNLAADTGLALALDVRRALRPDLRLLIMSATLNPQTIAAHLGDADIHSADATCFPVSTHLLTRESSASLPTQATNAILNALQNNAGSLLVFLPGEGEIRRTAELLQNSQLPATTTVYPLYSALPRELQEAAIAPTHTGQRKIVLATSIADTSLTIEGIQVVIDTGWTRLPRFSPRHGMSHLETVRLTRDRADQRRGRAGRLGPGVCYRLWDKVVDQQLAPEALPEIYDADLCATVLQAAEWGTAARDGLPWFTPPPDASWRCAVTLLQELGALTQPRDSLHNSTPTITPRGRAMVKLPLHPRLAHMIFEAAQSNCAQRACLLAALIAEAATDTKMRRETDAQSLFDHLKSPLHTGFRQRVNELARRWGRNYPENDKQRLSIGLLLAWAYPDRIARRRDRNGRYLLRSGHGALLDPADPLNNSEWLVAVELQDSGVDATIRLAAPITYAEITTFFAGDFATTTLTFWDRAGESVRALQRVVFGAITIKEGGAATPDPLSLRQALYEGIRQKGLASLLSSKTVRSLQARVCFLHKNVDAQTWPDLADAVLLTELDAWLGPFCDGITRWSQLCALDLTTLLWQYLEARGCSRRRLDELAPTHIIVPSGSRIPIQYDQGQPCLAVRIQEIFGLTQTPVIAGGRVALIMHLLSPSQRPVQITGDLKSFWANGYALVRKDLRGRYPKHNWPENPYTAIPSQRIRPKTT